MTALAVTGPTRWRDLPVVMLPPKEFNERIRTETSIWDEIIRRENLQLD